MSTTEEKIAELKDTIATLEAFGRGESTQWQRSDGMWSDDSDPLYSIGQRLRIRVKPKPRDWWLNVYEGDCVGGAYRTKALADEMQNEGRTLVHVREVIE